MKRFEFRLEALRQLKNGLLELEEHRLQRLLGEQEHLRRQRQLLQEEVRRQRELLLRSPEIPGATLLCYGNYQATTRKRLERFDDEILRLEGKIRTQREKVRGFEVEVRLLDRQRDRDYRQWLAEMNKEIEQLGAEAYLSRFVREQNEGDPGK